MKAGRGWGVEYPISNKEYSVKKERPDDFPDRSFGSAGGTAKFSPAVSKQVLAAGTCKLDIPCWLLDIR